MRKFFASLFRPFGRFFHWVSTPFRKVRSFLNDEPEDRPLGEAFEFTVEQPSQLLDHIDALRKHLIRMLIAVVIGVAVCAVFTQEILDFLAAPIGGIGQLQVIEPTETVGVFMKVALFCGLALVFPYLAFELWLFAAPGLKVRARRMGLWGIFLAVPFFAGGMAFTYWVMFPAALNFLLSGVLAVESNWRLSSYFSFVTGLLFWIGTAFEFPLVMYVLTDMGLIRPKMLGQHWRIAIIVIAVLAAAITPTADPVNMGLVMLPMILLYFLSMGLSNLAALRRAKKG